MATAKAPVGLPGVASSGPTVELESRAHLRRGRCARETLEFSSERLTVLTPHRKVFMTVLPSWKKVVFYAAAGLLALIGFIVFRVKSKGG